jgi:hypothetical protein
MRILDNHSPYYLTFDHENTDEIIRISKNFVDWDLLNLEYWGSNKKFINRKLDPWPSKCLINLVPNAKELQLLESRVCLFISAPGLWYQPHRDGYNVKHKFGINYPISIQDDRCITNWYSDDICKGREIDTIGGKSTEVTNFDPALHTPLCSTIFKPGKPVLFNTDIFHNWDNSQSPNMRIMLTFRSDNENINFKKAKEILVGTLQ